MKLRPMAGQNPFRQGGGDARPDLASLLRGVAAVAVAVTVAGCGAFSELIGSEPPPPCPTVSVLKDASVVTHFREGGGTDIVDVLNRGEITGFTISCEFDVDDDTGIGTITSDVIVQITASRGAADRLREATYTYFVALTDPGREVLAKKQFDTTVEFPGNLTVVTVQDEPVGLSIPISPERGAGYYEIFIGFQLTHDEMEYNRRQQAVR